MRKDISALETGAVVRDDQCDRWTAEEDSCGHGLRAQAVGQRDKTRDEPGPWEEEGGPGGTEGTATRHHCA